MSNNLEMPDSFKKINIEIVDMIGRDDIMLDLAKKIGEYSSDEKVLMFLWTALKLKEGFDELLGTFKSQIKEIEEDKKRQE